MENSNGLPKTFPLRLPFTMHLEAIELARRDGISLNRFIVQAIAETITRLESSPRQEDQSNSEEEPGTPRESNEPMK